jgi:hypothetical protein
VGGNIRVVAVAGSKGATGECPGSELAERARWASIVGQRRRASALPVLDSDGRPQFLHLLIIDMRLAHKVSEGIGNRVQLALNRLVAPPLGVLKHCNQHHDDDRHDRRAGSQPGVRETSDDSEREPGQDTGNTSDKERPPTHGMHGCRSHFVESPSVTVDLAWRECPTSALLECLVLIHEATSTRGSLGRNPKQLSSRFGRADLRSLTDDSTRRSVRALCARR